jgi:hypothetical protein
VIETAIDCWAAVFWAWFKTGSGSIGRSTVRAWFKARSSIGRAAGNDLPELAVARRAPWRTAQRSVPATAVPLVPWHTRHFITADPEIGNGPEGVGRNAVVPLMLTQRGKRANVQNEILDREHHAAALILVGDAVEPGP